MYNPVDKDKSFDIYLDTTLKMPYNINQELRSAIQNTMDTPSLSALRGK